MQTRFIRYIVAFLIFPLLLLSISACYFSFAPSKTQYVYDQFGLGFIANQKAYLKHNVWYKDPMKISFFNYQQGKILPFGTEIKFIEGYHNSNYLIFETVNDRKKYKIINNPAVSLLSDKKLFHQFFTAVNLEKETASLPKEIVAKLKQGKIEVGMARKDVLLALGPPPLNLTPPGTKTTWIYFLNNTLKTTHIVFKNDKVTYVFEN